MNSDDISLIIWLYVLISIIASIFISLSLEKRLKARLPATRPYRWGFYIGCMGIGCVPLALLMALAALGAMKTNQPGVSTECFLYTAYFAVQAVCGWFIIKRKRWAWAIGTAASFNIVWWIANSIYAKNRWQEFVGVPYTPTPEELFEKGTNFEAKGQAPEALAIYQQIVEKYPNTSAGQDAQKSIESLRVKIG